MSHRKVTLLVPGYIEHRICDSDQGLAGDITSNQQSSINSAPVPRTLSVLEDLERQPWQAQLAQIFNLDTEGGKRLPGARVGMLDADHHLLTSELVNLTALVRADPISLKADKDSATLISADQLQLDEEESLELISALNDFVDEDGFMFFNRGASEWYMSGMSAEALATYPPSFLANRNASTFLPDGDGAAAWRRLMTEIQMLLHAHPVNQRREQRGLLPVNSVWFWGGASLPQAGTYVSAEESDVVLFADERQARLLAQHLGITCLPLADVASAINDLPECNDIVILDLSIFSAWLNKEPDQFEQELSRLNEHWLSPLCRQVAAGLLERVHLLTEDGLQGVCDEHTQNLGAPASQGWIARLRDVFRR